MNIKRNVVTLLISLPVFFLFTECKKTVPESKIQTDTFIKVYTEQNNQYCFSIVATTDGGFLLIGLNDDYSTLRLLKVDNNGNKLWLKNIDNIAFGDIVVKSLNDGTFTVNTWSSTTLWGSLVRFDENGNILFHTILTNSYVAKSAALKIYDGSFILGSSRGNNTPNKCQIQHYDSQGKYLDLIDINDNSFEAGFKQIGFYPVKASPDGTYYVSGLCYPKWNGNPRNNNAKAYIAKQKYLGSTLIENKLLKIDSTDTDGNYGRVFVDTTTTNEMIALLTVWNSNGIPNGKILKVDTNLNVIWKKEIFIGAKYTICFQFTECPDGGFLVSGMTSVPDKTSGQPFACKFDANGNLLWSQIYPTALFGELDNGIQDKWGNFYLAGYTNGAGNGETGNDFLFIKTNSAGKVK